MMKEYCDKLYLLYDALIGFLFPGVSQSALETVEFV